MYKIQKRRAVKLYSLAAAFCVCLSRALYVSFGSWPFLAAREHDPARRLTAWKCCKRCEVSRFVPVVLSCATHTDGWNEDDGVVWWTCCVAVAGLTCIQRTRKQRAPTEVPTEPLRSVVYASENKKRITCSGPDHSTSATMRSLLAGLNSFFSAPGALCSTRCFFFRVSDCVITRLSFCAL